MMEMTLHILFVILLAYLLINIIYLLIFSIAGRFRKISTYSPSTVKNRIAICIPSHSEDSVIINTASAASNHDYPPDYFHVFIAADHTSEETLYKLNQLNVTVYPLKFERGSKARSLNHLLNTINEHDFDIALVLDGDNIMRLGFLEKINAAFNKGYKCVQGHRIAKNKNTAIATLDAVSEEINNHLFRNAQRALGFSSSLIGSGMAFEFKKLKEIYNKPGILDNPACDREVDFEITKSGISIEYLKDAEVLDEKVSESRVFRRQRRRWLESQLIHLKLFFTERVKHKNRDYWNKLFINLIPPRIVFIILLATMFIFSVKWGIILFSAYVFTMLICVPRKLYTWNTFRSLLSLPLIILTYILALGGIRPSRKEFVHTPKSFE